MINEEQAAVAAAMQPPPQEAPPEDWKDKYFRALAEMENMRKRLQKEKQEVSRLGVENAIAEFIFAIDSFETALRFAEQTAGEVKSWAMGFEMILAQFKEVLHNHGVVAFHSTGNLFDPQIHEAVEIVETSDTPHNTILEEFTKGYKSGHRTLRAARVKVSRHPHQHTNFENNHDQ
ncbi:MAG: hypothetical protein RL235_31 [Chlamydiota bacterium]|jgi:molecular chaperone GrpE